MFKECLVAFFADRALSGADGLFHGALEDNNSVSEPVDSFECLDVVKVAGLECGECAHEQVCVVSFDRDESAAVVDCEIAHAACKRGKVAGECADGRAQFGVRWAGVAAFVECAAECFAVGAVSGEVHVHAGRVDDASGILCRDGHVKGAIGSGSVGVIAAGNAGRCACGD